MKKPSFLFVVGFVVAVAAHEAHGGTISEFYAAFRNDQLPQQNEPDRRRTSRIDAAYRMMFSRFRGETRTRSSADLRTLLAAATDAAFYLEDPTPVSDARHYLEALRHRGSATVDDLRPVYEVLLQHRMFADASKLYMERNGAPLPSPPSIITDPTLPASAATAYVFDGHFALKSLHPPETGILVTATPDCHFSLDAARAIYNDKQLAAIFANSVWLAPAQYPLNAEKLKAWRAKFPAATLAIADRNSEWAIVDHWGTPSFYFFLHGKLVAKQSGWSPGDARAALANGLQAIGIVLPPTAWRHQPPTADQAAAPDPSPSEQGRFEIDVLTAPIRSKAELASFLAITPTENSAFAAIPADRRQQFLRRVQFNASGSRDLPLDALGGLTRLQAYRILALFGWQTRISKVATRSD